MLKEILEKHYPKRKTPLLPRVPDQFDSAFMKALKADADEHGIIDEANRMILEKVMQNEELNETRLDDTWKQGILEGYETGLEHGYTPGFSKGIVTGLVSGWKDAETFKDPHRVYDLSTPTIVPIAKNKHASLLGETIPDTIENRLWRSSTDLMAKKKKGYELKHFQEISHEPFVYHPEQKRLGLNLKTFMEAGDDVKGVEANIAGNGQTIKKSVTKRKEAVISDAIGNKDQRPKLNPDKIPPRPGRKVKQETPAEPQPTPTNLKTPKNVKQRNPNTPMKLSAKVRKTDKKLAKLGIETPPVTPVKVPKGKGERHMPGPVQVLGFTDDDMKKLTSGL